MKNKHYYISSIGYEKRARSQLESGTKAGLFYAAFELRSGIEARMKRYLEASQKITRLKKKGWQIAKMAAQLESIFPVKGRTCKVTVLENATKVTLCEAAYIPVTDKLKKAAERLGAYLHCMRKAHDDDDPWWPETREMLESVYCEFQRVNTGVLMGPPLLNPKTNEVHLEMEVEKDNQEMIAIFNKAFSQKKFITVKVEYENPPAVK